MATLETLSFSQLPLNTDDDNTARLNRYASTLNNTGVILFQRGRSYDAMKKFQDAIKTLKSDTTPTNGDDSNKNTDNAEIEKHRREQRQRPLPSSDDEREATRYLSQLQGRTSGDVTSSEVGDKKIDGMLMPSRKKRRGMESIENLPVIDTTPIMTPLTATPVSSLSLSTTPIKLALKTKASLSATPPSYRRIIGAIDKMNFSEGPTSQRNRNNKMLNVLPFGNPLTLRLDEDNDKFISPSVKTYDVTLVAEVILFNMALLQYHWGGILPSIDLFSSLLSLVDLNVMSDQATNGNSTRITDSNELDRLVSATLHNICEIYLSNRKFEDAKSIYLHELCRGKERLINLGYREVITGVFGMQVSSDDTCRKKRSVVRDPCNRAFLSRVAMALCNLSRTNFFLKNMDEALRNANLAIMFTKASYDDDESDNDDRIFPCVLYYNIGVVLYHKKEFRKSLINFDKALRLSTILRANKSIQSSHPFIATIIHNIGEVYHHLGNLNDAMMSYLRALDARKQMNPSLNSPYIGESLSSLASVLHDKEDYKAALEVYEEALQRHTIVHGSDALVVATTLCDMGRLHHSTGDLEESLNVYREVVRISRRVFGNRHYYVAKILNVIGNIQIEKGQIGSGMNAFAEALRIMRELRIQNDKVGDKGDGSIYEVVKNPMYNIHVKRLIMADTA